MNSQNANVLLKDEPLQVSLLNELAGNSNGIHMLRDLDSKASVLVRELEQLKKYDPSQLEALQAMTVRKCDS